MAETKRTSRPTSQSDDRRYALTWSVKRGAFLLAIVAFPLILIVRGASVREPVAALAAILLGLALLLLPIFVLQGLDMWFGWTKRLKRLQMKRFQQRLSALSDAQKAPFQIEQRCKLSATEEVWVEHKRYLQSGYILSLDVRHSRDGGKTWERLPLRLSPWARFKCIILDGEWPPTSASRNLSCDKDGISLEVIGADYWDNWPNVWRATYRPRRKWWTLKIVGPLWLRGFSEHLLNGESQR
jgi:hypothetical protein